MMAGSLRFKEPWFVEERCVIDVEEGRDKETVANFCKKLVEKGGNPANILAVTSDMSKSFCPAIAENFPNASHIIDRFHVKQIVTTAMDEVRKQEQKDVDDKKSLFQSRRLFMVPQAKLTEGQTANLASLSKRFPKTGKAYQIVAALDDFYRSATTMEAESAFNRLCPWMRRCRLEPMKEAALSLMRHRGKILAYFTNPTPLQSVFNANIIQLRRRVVNM